MKVGMAISIWHRYHHATSYSASSSMFVDVMPLCNHGSYILIEFLRLIGGNAVLRDKMIFFLLISSFALLFSELRRLISIQSSVDKQNGYSRFIC